MSSDKKTRPPKAGTPKAGTPKDSHYARLRRAHRRIDDDDRTPRRSSHNAPAPVPDGLVRLYGLHTVREAMDNPARQISRLLVTRNAISRLGLPDIVANPNALPYQVEIVDPRDIDRILGADAVHQGALLEARPLKPKRLSALTDTPLIIVLDQVTDPHNVGAILRSAVAFGAGALITTARHSPSESGVLAKSASGALEHIDLITVRNLAESLEQLQQSGFETIGLDSEGPALLEDSFSSDKIALVLGAEGKGLRQKTRATVNALARLDMPGPIRSLNISNATAIALYAARSHLTRPGK